MSRNGGVTLHGFLWHSGFDGSGQGVMLLLRRAAASRAEERHQDQNSRILKYVCWIFWVDMFASGLFTRSWGCILARYDGGGACSVPMLGFP